MAKFFYTFLALGVALASAQTNYNAGDSGRSETIAPDGSVQGQYSYTDPNGKLITVKYRAGKDGYFVEGDHLPKPPSAGPPAPSQNSPVIPDVPRHTDPAVLNYNPFINPNVPSQSIAPVPQAHNSGYNPFYNPHVPSQPAAPLPAPAPVPQNNNNNNNGYNPFYNPHVPSHLYQQAPTPAPAPVPQYHHQPQAPQHQAPAQVQVPNVPQHTDPAVLSYNPFVNPLAANYNPFHNPNVPASAYQNAPNSQHAQAHHQQQPAYPQVQSNSIAPAHHSQQLPAGTFSHKLF